MDQIPFIQLWMQYNMLLNGNKTWQLYSRQAWDWRYNTLFSIVNFLNQAMKDFRQLWCMGYIMNFSSFFWHQYWDDFCTKQMFPVNVNVYKIALNSVIIWTIIALAALWVRIFFGDLSLSMGRKVHVWQIMSLYMYNKQLNQALVEIKLILSWFFPVYIHVLLSCPWFWHLCYHNHNEIP